MNPKIYLDTSVISHLEQPEKPYEQAYSHELLRRIKDGDFVVFLSSIVFNEIRACSPLKRYLLMQYTAKINYEEILITEAIKALASKIISWKILPPKCIDDSQHIAAAIIAGCNYVVSWNMKDMSNVDVNKGIRLITIDEGYKEIMLVPPPMLLRRNLYEL